jgi:hypothetical protein
MIPKPTVRQLYKDGLSTRQIAAKVGISRSYAHKICRDITRTKSEAAILRQPALSKHWRSTRRQARVIWQRVNGQIPKGFHIHHIDGDHTNNAIENLQCISAVEHMKYHHAGPEYHIPRHLRPARKAYMKEYLKTYDSKT